MIVSIECNVFISVTHGWRVKAATFILFFFEKEENRQPANMRT